MFDRRRVVINSSLLVAVRRTVTAVVVSLAASSALLAPAAEAAPVTGRTCTASVTNAKPKVGAQETVLVGTTKNATVNIKVRYKTTTHPYSFTADSGGKGRFAFSTGHPTAGYTVVVDVTTSSKQTCSTKFTPQ